MSAYVILKTVGTTPDGLRNIYNDTDGVVDIMLTNSDDGGRSKNLQHYAEQKLGQRCITERLLHQSGCY